MWLKPEHSAFLVNARHIVRLAVEITNHGRMIVATLSSGETVPLVDGLDEEEAQGEVAWIAKQAESERTRSYPQAIEQARAAARRRAAEPATDWVPEDDGDEEEPPPISAC
jgi:hypothetical protein